jgi:predicted phosphodiesterase
MRRFAAALAAVVASSALGGANAESASGADWRYVSPGAALHFAVARVPRASELMGRIAARAVALAAGRGVPGAETLPAVAGELETPAAPAGWRVAEPAALRAMRSGPAPLGAMDGARGCKCATPMGDTTRERIAAVYAVTTFEIGGELERLRLVRIRARYAAGIIVHLNGVEVARRAIEADDDAVAFARRSRGPEWETFTVPAVPGLLRRGTNALAVEVRPSPFELAPHLDLELEAEERAAITRGPILQRVGASSATVVFDTDLPTRGAVEYGPTDALGRVAISAGGALARHHVVELVGLPEHAAIAYRLVAGDSLGERQTLHTAPAPDSPLRIGVYGDVRGGHDVHEALVASLAREAPDLVLMTGDMVARGTDEGDWQRFFAATAELMPSIPYYPVIGNHDLGRAGDEQRRMNEIFALWPGPADRPEWGHWYSFTVAGVHIVMLDSNSYAHAEQLAWLADDLRATRAANARAILAVAHDGPYSHGPHGGNERAALLYAPLLRAHGVAIMFTGHEHIYQRGEVDGLVYVVSGGGGAPLYRPRCGVGGRPACPRADGVRRIESAYHYVMVTVYAQHAELCAKRPDGAPLERCVRVRLDAERAP